MHLENPKIGPLLGHTTSHTARFMAGIEGVTNKDKIYCGWLRYRKEGADWEKAVRFRFGRNFFYTGVIEIRGLEEGTNYEYQIAYTSDYSEHESIDPELWITIFIHRFRTQQSGEELNFCFGSCLRANENDSRVGKVLKNVKSLHQNKPLNFMLWLGDQIYNDKLSTGTPFNWSRDNFSEKYEKDFFSNPYVKSILPAVPNYMVMDDHEVEDGYKRGTEEYNNPRFEFLSFNKERLYNGVLAYYSYQASHGPIFDTARDDKQDNVYFVKGQDQHNQVPVKHYAEVDLGMAGLFLADVRKERSIDRMISNHQEKSLLEFLSKDQYKVKLIATSVTFLADYNNVFVSEADNWERAPGQRERILNYISDNNIKNVFFLSGDVHSHFAARLYKNDAPTSVFQLVSGSLFWPTSFGFNLLRWIEEDIPFGEPISGAPGYSLSKPMSDTDTSYFANNGVGHVRITPEFLEFKVFNHSGSIVISTKHELE